MVRRAPSSATDDSLKENSGVHLRSLKVKAEKVEKAKDVRAARVETEDEEEDTQARDSASNEDDEDESDEDDELADREGSPKGRKRARANTQGDARPSGSKYKGKAKAEPKTLPRDEDGYIPGSIVRIQLRNFVTYDWVEFTPGPYLNMVLGPNGTGKSSIACAICLGLNFPPSVLGRASDLPSFVKLGKDDGHIEIELKGPKGKPNLVIRRMLNARSKTNQFTLNGVSATGREINQRMQELNVQVTNLCSFLPQDKVAEFAAMTRPQLLRETQRAAGNANLTTWHDTLIEAGRELKGMKEKLDGDKTRLQNDQERNAGLERDVKKYEERQELERSIELLELLLPFREYTEALIVYEEARAAQRKAHEEVKALAQSLKPITDLKDQLQKQLDDLNRRREALKTSTKHKFQNMRKKAEDAEALEHEIEEVKTRLDNLRKDEKTRAKKIDSYNEKIAQYQKEIDNPPDDGALKGINEDLKTINLACNAITQRQRDLQDRQREVVSQEAALKAKIDENNKHLKQLDDADHRKLHNLTQWDKDCGDTVAWLRANSGRFRMEILEPAMLSLTIPDQRFIASVEACFAQNDLKTFVAQCEEDYQLLNRLVADTPEALGRRARINTWYRAQGQPSRPPLSKDELKNLGFDGYAMDYVVCPDGMRWYLENAISLQRTAIALDPRRVDPVEAMNTLSREGSINYIVGNVLNMVRRSKYGRRLAQNNTREIGPARNLATTTIDLSVKRQHEQAIAEAQRELEMCKEEIDKLSEQDSEIRAEWRQVNEKKNSIVARRDNIHKAQKAYERAKMNLTNARVELERLRNAPSADTERVQLRDKILKLAKRRAELVKAIHPIMRAAIKEQVECTQVGLQVLQVGANSSALENLSKERQEEHDRALVTFNALDARYKEVKKDVRDKLIVSKAKLEQCGETTRDKFHEMEASGEKGNDPRTADQLETELGTLKAELDMNMQTNAGVVEQYRQRQIEIARLSQSIDELEEKIAKVQDRIQRTRAMWEPALMQLVDSIGENFSSAFDRIGCAGEVRVAKHEEDFDKWAIEIHVKFRDDEKLQLLTAERQSGGERSLTTILYLMSLTAEARAPFSLVDEINQGMDAVYERTVHNSLVDVTCKADSGQYFLITPKLLSDLHYHERMKILCVNNGEWLPDDNPSGSLTKMIDAYLLHQSADAA